MMTLHDETSALMKSNRWQYAYALGYASGRDDARNRRQKEHKATESDDYAKGYHRGYAAVESFY